MRNGRPTWLKSARTTPIIFESEDLAAFRETLPKGVSLSEGIRELIRVSLDEQKNGEAPQRLPIMPRHEIRQTSLIEYTINNINSLVETPDDVLNDIVLKVSKKRANQIFDKFGSVRRTIMKAHPR